MRRDHYLGKLLMVSEELQRATRDYGAATSIIVTSSGFVCRVFGVEKRCRGPWLVCWSLPSPALVCAVLAGSGRFGEKLLLSKQPSLALCYAFLL